MSGRSRGRREMGRKEKEKGERIVEKRDVLDTVRFCSSSLKKVEGKRSPSGRTLKML